MSSGLDLSIPLDDDWGVSTASGDGGHAEVTLGDNASGTEVTLRGPVVQLIDLLETALADLVDYRIKADGSRLDAKLATLAEHTERAIGLATAIISPEPLATPDEMVPGGWVRFPGCQTWRQVTELRRFGQGLARDIRYDFGGVTYSERVAAHDTLPYLTDAEFQAECDRRTDAQDLEDEAADRMLAAEWGAGLLDSFTKDGAA